MNIVGTMTTKDERIYIRLTNELKEKFRTVAEYRGLKMSALLHLLVVKTIREEEKENPTIFGKPKTGRMYAEVTLVPDEDEDELRKTG